MPKRKARHSFNEVEGERSGAGGPIKIKHREAIPFPERSGENFDHDRTPSSDRTLFDGRKKAPAPAYQCGGFLSSGNHHCLVLPVLAKFE